MEPTPELIEAWAREVVEAEVPRVADILDRGALAGEYRVALAEVRERFRRLTVTQRERVIVLIGETGSPS